MLSGEISNLHSSPLSYLVGWAFTTHPVLVLSGGISKHQLYIWSYLLRRAYITHPSYLVGRAYITHPIRSGEVSISICSNNRIIGFLPDPGCLIEDSGIQMRTLVDIDGHSVISELDTWRRFITSNQVVERYGNGHDQNAKRIGYNRPNTSQFTICQESTTSKRWWTFFNQVMWFFGMWWAPHHPPHPEEPPG